MKNDKKKTASSKKETVSAYSYEQTLERLRAREKKIRIVRIVLRIALVISCLYFVLFCDVMAALGWISNARSGENWPIHFVTYGQMMIFAVVLITAGVILCLCRCNRIAMLLAVPGTVLSLVLMELVAGYADEAGFYSTLRDMTAGAVYRDAILPTAFVCILLIALALMQYFSMDSVQKRREKKMHEEDAAPKIV